MASKQQQKQIDITFQESISFANFTALYNSAILISGTKYNITDYQNVERIPNQTYGNRLNIDEATVPTESIVCTAIANNKIDNRCVSLTYEGEFVYINMDQNNLTQNFYYENDHTSGNTQDDGAFLSVGVSYTITGPDTVEIVTNGPLDYTRYFEFYFENGSTSYSYYVGDTLQTLIDDGDVLVSQLALNTYEFTFVDFAEDYLALRNSFDEYYGYFSAETTVVEIQGRVYGRTRPEDNVEIWGCDPRTRVVAIYEVDLSVINKSPQYCYLATGGISNAGFVFSLTGNVRYDFMFENMSTFNESQNVHIGQSTNSETSFYIAGLNRIENLTMRSCGRSYFELAPRNSFVNEINSNICLGPWNSTDVTGYLNLVIFGDGVDNSTIEVLQFSFYEQYLSNANLQAQVIINHRIRSTAISPTNILDVQGGFISNLFMDCGANIPQNLKIKAVSLNFITINGICRDSEISGRTVNTNTFSTLSGSRIFAKNDILNNTVGSFLNNTFNVETFSNVTVAALNENNITCKLFTAITGGGIIRNLVLYASGNFTSWNIANTFDNATGVCSSITDLTTLNNTVGHKFLGGVYSQLVLSSNINVSFNGGASNATISGNQTDVTYAKKLTNCEVSGTIVNSHFLGGITNASLLMSSMNNTVVDQEIYYPISTVVSMSSLDINDGAAVITGSTVLRSGFGLIIYVNSGGAAATLQIDQDKITEGSERDIKDISGNALVNNVTLTGLGAATITVDGVVNPIIALNYGKIKMKKIGAVRYTV